MHQTTTTNGYVENTEEKLTQPHNENVGSWASRKTNLSRERDCDQRMKARSPPCPRPIAVMTFCFQVIEKYETQDVEHSNGNYCYNLNWMSGAACRVRDDRVLGNHLSVCVPVCARCEKLRQNLYFSNLQSLAGDRWARLMYSYSHLLLNRDGMGVNKDKFQPHASEHDHTVCSSSR